MRSPFLLLSALFLMFLGTPSFAAQPAEVDILFMNHGPLRATVKELRAVLANHEGKVNAHWYDFESKEGEAFMESRGIREHVPLIIWINGSYTHKIDGVDVVFRGFPSGSGPTMVQGAWTMDMLNKALEQATR